MDIIDNIDVIYAKMRIPNSFKKIKVIYGTKKGILYNNLYKIKQKEIDMADTPKIKLMSNLNLNDNSFIIKDTTRITFPDNPIEGIECLVNGINYIYTILDGFLSWIPTSINRETKNLFINS